MISEPEIHTTDALSFRKRSDQMLSDEQIRRESRSRIYLSQRTEEEKDRLKMEILEYL